MLRFHSLAKRPKHFLHFTGFSVLEFMELVKTIRNDWKAVRLQRCKQNRIRKIGGGAKGKLPNLEDRLLLFAIYARLYLPYVLLEYMVGIDESTICRLVKEMTPLLSAKIIVQRPGKRIRTLEELKALFPDLDEVLMDATEQRIPRPQKKRMRKTYHSGKKKAFTIKTQILTDTKGVILSAADSSPGRVHDYKYFKNTTVPQWLGKNPQITCYADSGYQGVATDYPHASFRIPAKRSRAKKELSRSEKIQNTKQRRKRVVVEHTLSSLKKFRILADIYRNAKEHYSATFKSVCFLSNFRMVARQAA